MEETSDLFGPPTADSGEPSQSTFDELIITLLSNSAQSDQAGLDDQIEIGLLQLQMLEDRNCALERSLKEKGELKQRLAERESRWSELNSQLDGAIDLMVDRKMEVSQSEVGLQMELEKKLNYLNFLLESAEKSTDSESLRRFLAGHSRPLNAESPFSVAMHGQHFQLNAAESTNYDADGLARLAGEMEDALRGFTTVDSDAASSCLTNDRAHLPTQNQLSLWAVESSTQPSQSDAGYAAVQLNNIISNIGYLKSKETSTEKSQTESDESDRRDDLKRRDDLEKQAALTSKGLEEFTDEFDDVMACFQLPATGNEECAAGGDQQSSSNNNEQTNFESNYQLAYSPGHQATNDDHEARESSDVAERQANEAENFEMDLSIDSRAAANTTSLSFDFFKPMLKPMNNIAIKDRKLFNCNFDAITSLSSDQFFSNVSESVIVKPKKKNDSWSVHSGQPDRKQNEKSTEDDEFDFKTSLSSQIPFDQF